MIKQLANMRMDHGSRCSLVNLEAKNAPNLKKLQQKVF